MRLFKVITSSLLAVVLSAPAAFASQPDNGKGLLGEINDRTITYGGFLVIAFFITFVSVVSAVQAKLERRKYSKLASKHSSAGRYLGGW